MSLVEQFFEADLSEAEADQLEAQLLASPEAAEQMLALAERDYRASGLPTPKRSGGGRSKMGLFLILGAGLAASGGGLWLSKGASPKVQVAQEDGASFSEGQAEPEAAAPLKQDQGGGPQQPAAPAPIPAAEPARHSRRVGLQVEGAQTGQLKVVVYGSSGRCVRHVYEGLLGEGRHKLAWDGRLDDGSRAPAGRYVVEVQSAAGVSRQEIKL